MKKGLVLKSTGSWYTVEDEDGNTYSCKIRGKLRLKGTKTTNPVTVGDWVDFTLESDEEAGSIERVHDRQNYIIRRSINLSREAHIIAANIDQAVLVITIDFPTTQLEFIDRYLATAEAYRIPATLVFNKVDLFQDELKDKLSYIVNLYRNINYNCVEVSAKTGYNIDALKELLVGKVSLLSGNSGVGKSTLVNLIEPGLNLKTGEISGYHLKGKHTTTFSEMFKLKQGGYIIDTPGIKGFGVVDMEQNEISHFFPDLFKYAKDCKFYNCTHIHEPGCAVLKAVDENLIYPSRYLSYMSLFNDEDEKYRT